MYDKVEFISQREKGETTTRLDGLEEHNVQVTKINNNIIIVIYMVFDSINFLNLFEKSF